MLWWLVARFDQCMFGMIFEVDTIPMRERTKLTINMTPLYAAVDLKFSHCGHDH